METLEFLAETAGERIDALLPRIAADLTRSAAQRLLESGAVRVNGSPVRKNYRVAAGDAVSVTLPDPDTQAYILEAIAYASRADLTPAYYDICLKSKYPRDEESSEMLDIIFSSYHLELAEVYSFANLAEYVNNCLSTNGNISSVLAAVDTMVKKSIQKTAELYANNNDW